MVALCGLPSAEEAVVRTERLLRHRFSANKVDRDVSVREPLWENFLDCSIRVIEPPVLSASDTETGTFTLQWISSPPQALARYVLEEATSTNFTDSVQMYAGLEVRHTVYGRRPGNYYYRVRAEIGRNTSDWSNGVAIRVASASPWKLNNEGEYTSNTLLAVQRAAANVRGTRDLFAVLALPEHYREESAMNHVAALKATPEQADLTEEVFPLGYGETNAFSYGALYHPWLIGREGDVAENLRHIPPDGATCGIFAQRALTRGAWIAPANEPLSNVVALAPRIAGSHWWSLQEAQLNIIRQEPRGFVTLNSDTLSHDEDFRPINVRRLIMLLRRLALRLGTTYVFEPQNDAFHRSVERGFEAMLARMFVRGAFAGETPASSFQVVVSDSLNTRQSVEQGRFIVELRVAPSRPLTFLTIRLVQTGNRGVVTESR